MADKIPTDIRSLALSLHTDLTTLNTYADNPTMVTTLADMIRTKLHTIRFAVDDVAGAPNIVGGAVQPVARGWDEIEAGREACPVRVMPE